MLPGALDGAAASVVGEVQKSIGAARDIDDGSRPCMYDGDG